MDGVVAQLVEHHNGIVGVRGSNPLGSTILLQKLQVNKFRKVIFDREYCLQIIPASNPALPGEFEGLSKFNPPRYCFGKSNDEYIGEENI